MKLNKSAANHAKKLINESTVVRDERAAWSELQPSAAKRNQFIRAYGFGEHGKWHLGIDDAENEQTKMRYKLSYGDFKKVDRCALLTGSRAGQDKHFDIENAAAHLHGINDVRAQNPTGEWRKSI